jgi:RimJ/RimL family protein N-acetyltransferase
MPRLGYWIGPRHWGRGLGTEAVGAVVGYAFRTHPADRVGAGVFGDNPASRRVLEKLGFAPAGAYRTHSRSRGERVETVDMQLSRAAWAAGSARP